MNFQKTKTLIEPEGYEPGCSGWISIGRTRTRPSPAAISGISRQTFYRWRRRYEFAALFEQACQQRGLRLFVLPPRSPKLNGSLERANRTHAEELYQLTPFSLELNKLNRELRHWDRIYNTVRPRQSMGYLTAHQFLLQLSSQRKE